MQAAHWQIYKKINNNNNHARLLDSRWPDLDSCCHVAACIGRYRGAGKGAGYRGLGWDAKPREEPRNVSAFSGSGSVKRGDHSRAGRNRQ